MHSQTVLRIKVMFLLLTLALLSFSCTKNELSESEIISLYKLDQQYMQNYQKFSSLNLNNEAYNSCKQMFLIRNDCFALLIEERMSKKIPLEKSVCEEIKPTEKSALTYSTIKQFYDNLTFYTESDFKKDFYSNERTNLLKKIKSECYAYVKLGRVK